MNDCTQHKDLKLNRTRNGPYASKQVLSKGSSFLLMRVSFSLLVCEELLKGIVYPLAVKIHNVPDLVHQKECLNLGCS